MKFSEQKWRSKAQIDADNLDLELKECQAKLASLTTKMLEKSFLKNASLQEIHQKKAAHLEAQKKVLKLKRKQEKMRNLK